MRLAVALVLAAAAVAAPGEAAGAEDLVNAVARSYGRSWALVIGINAYERAPRLNYAVDDARAVAAALPALGFPAANIKMILDRDATRARIESVLYRDLARIGPDDRLLIYFAGHGHTLAVRGGEEGYFLPADADPEALPATAMLMEDMRRIGKRVRAKHVLFVMDACFSGFSVTRDIAPARISDAYLDAALREPVVQVITAGRKGERAIEEGGHGLFTRRLLDGLRGLADTEGRGIITAAQLAAWVEPRVTRDSDGRMHPQYSKLDGEGQFVFVRPVPDRPVVAAIPAPLEIVPKREPPLGRVLLGSFTFRRGPYGGAGTPMANGFRDYLTMLNERDGGVNGIRLVVEECEMEYDTRQGVECYERLRPKNPVLISPSSTGVAYQLIPKALTDRFVLFSMGFGMTAASDGRWFPWVFNGPANYWSQTAATVRYIASVDGGVERLRGRKIAHLHHNSPFGREPHATLTELSRRYGFDLTLVPVDHPGLHQQAAWQELRRANPDWILLTGWGVMNETALREASAAGFRMDRIIGGLWIEPIRDVVRPQIEAAAATEGKKLNYSPRDCARES